MALVGMVSIPFGRFFVVLGGVCGGGGPARDHPNAPPPGVSIGVTPSPPSLRKSSETFSASAWNRATYRESVHPERNVLASASSAFEVMNAGYTSPEVASVGMLGNDEVRREH